MHLFCGKQGLYTVYRLSIKLLTQIQASWAEWGHRRKSAYKQCNDNMSAEVITRCRESPVNSVAFTFIPEAAVCGNLASCIQYGQSEHLSQDLGFCLWVWVSQTYVLSFSYPPAGGDRQVSIDLVFHRVLFLRLDCCSWQDNYDIFLWIIFSMNWLWKVSHVFFLTSADWLDYSGFF